MLMFDSLDSFGWGSYFSTFRTPILRLSKFVPDALFANLVSIRDGCCWLLCAVGAALSPHSCIPYIIRGET